MKNTFFRLIVPVLLIAGFSLILSSCQQEEMGPNIVAESIDYGSCCGNVVEGDNEREVTIVLDNLTANYYCTDGKSLTYEFSTSNPADDLIVEVSDNVSPTFCVPAVNLNLIIRHNTSSSQNYSVTPATCQP